MNQTDPTLDRVTTPYSLSQQLRLLMRDRDTDIATLQVMGEMVSRCYLESLNNESLIRVIDKTRRSVNDIMATPIIDGASGSGYNRVNIGDVLDPPERYLRYAIRYTEEIVIQYEIEISRRIAYDAMDILSQRYEESDNE